MASIGDRIRQRREQIGMSQADLAVLAGYKSRASINKMELGQRDLPQSKIKTIADALHTTPGYLMGWEDEPPEDEDKKNSAPELSESALKLLDIIDRLSPENQQVMLKFAKVLLQERADD